jgi:hypothetical protein
MRFSCSCGKTFAVPEEMAGRKATCPSCGQALLIPRSTAPTSSPDVGAKAPAPAGGVASTHAGGAKPKASATTVAGIAALVLVMIAFPFVMLAAMGEEVSLWIVLIFLPIAAIAVVAVLIMRKQGMREAASAASAASQASSEAGAGLKSSALDAPGLDLDAHLRSFTASPARPSGRFAFAYNTFGLVGALAGIGVWLVIWDVRFPFKFTIAVILLVAAALAALRALATLLTKFPAETPERTIGRFVELLDAGQRGCDLAFSALTPLAQERFRDDPGAMVDRWQEFRRTADPTGLARKWRVAGTARRAVGAHAAIVGFSCAADAIAGVVKAQGAWPLVTHGGRWYVADMTLPQDESVRGA